MHAKSTSDLPPGFRFHPTDEELIMCYLRNQATSRPCPASIIPEVDIYKFDPWQLPEKAEFGENEWYFFTPRDRKYPNGVRPNRATVSGYWKATGTDKAISSGSKYVGCKKALVFYKGRPPKGIKTDWIMHEYRLNDSRKQIQKQNGSMRVCPLNLPLILLSLGPKDFKFLVVKSASALNWDTFAEQWLDDWVLCRIYKKKHAIRHLEEEEEKMENTTSSSSIQLEITATANNNDANNHHHHQQQQQMFKLPRTFSLSHLLEFEYMGPISQLFNLDTLNPNYFEPQNIITGHVGKIEVGSEMPAHQYYTDSGKFQVNQ